MKKLISLLLVLSLSIFMFACGDKTETDASESSADTNTEESSNENEEAAESEESSGGAEVSGGGSVAEGVELPRVEEQVLYDEKDVKITVKAGEVEKDVLDQVLIPITIENNSESFVDITLDEVRINGITTDPLQVLALDGEAEAGTTVDANIGIDSDVIEEFGIEKLGDIVLDLRVEFEDEDEEVIVDDFEIVTSLSGQVEQAYEPTGTPLIDEGGIKLVLENELVEGSIGPELRFYLINDTEKYVKIENEGDYTINGKTVDAAFDFGVGPSQKTIYHLIIMDSDLEEVGVEKPIKSLSINLKGEDDKVIGEEIIAPFEVKMDF